MSTSDAHHVVITFKGKTIFDDIVNVELGAEVNVKPKAPVAVATGGGDDGDPGDDGGETKVRKPAPATSHDVFVIGGGVFDVGFRQFKYDQPKGLAATEREGGQVMLGPTIELWPAALIGTDHLRGLSLFGKLEFGLNHQAVLDTMDQATGATTSWQNLEIDARHRWHTDAAMIEVNGGFVRDQLQFKASNPMALALVPAVDYKAVRIGMRAGIKAGMIEPYVSAEGRIVINGGELGTRFESASVFGAAGAIGAAMTIGPVFARLEGSLLYYAWTFKDLPTATTSATGATDLVEVFSVIVGVTR